ncbi:hypothetical protein COOONC_09625 [Cooperia oncophora]
MPLVRAVSVVVISTITVLYDLVIKTYLPGYVNFPPEKNLTFDGQVNISMVVVEPTKSIVLNAKNITVIPEKCEVFSKFRGDQKLDIESVMVHERLEKLEFLLKKRLEKDQEIVLKVNYTGLISNTLGGLYQATYTTANGTTKGIPMMCGCVVSVGNFKKLAVQES